MRLEASVLVARSVEDVWSYLGDVSKISEWDRGVAAAERTRGTPPGVGFEFDTLALRDGQLAQDGWGRMSYRVAEIDPSRGCTVELTSTSGNARYFKRAEWRFRVEQEPAGSRVYCAADFSLRLRYLFLAPVLLAMRKAIRTDLEKLKQVLETERADACPRVFSQN